MTNPFLARLHKKGKTGHGQLSEEKTCKRLSGTLNPASGRFPGSKGDIEIPIMKVEAKCTTGKSIAIQHKWLSKISTEALHCGKAPAVTITFVTGDGAPKKYGRWVLLPEDYLEQLNGDNVHEGQGGR